MFDYLKEHPALAIVLIVCAALIVLSAIILIAKCIKSKKRTNRDKPKEEISSSVSASTALGETISEKKSAEVASLSHTSEPVGATENNFEKTEKTINEEKTAEKKDGEKQTNHDVKTNIAASDADISDKSEADPPKPKKEVPEKGKNTGKSAQSSAQSPSASNSASKSKKNKSKKESNAMNSKDFENVPEEEIENFYDEEDENDKIARYSGKWQICRVITSNAKSADASVPDETTEEMYFFELRASNGEKLLSSEEYTTYNGALSGIETHKANIERDNFKIMLSKKGDYIFKLLNGKNMLLCMGEHYASKARCESAIASAKRFAKTAIIDENVQDIVITPPPEDEGVEPELPDNGYNGKWIVSTSTALDGEQVFYFELFASNGEKLLSGEEYTTYIGAINGIGTYKTNIAKGNFRVSLTKRGDYIYKLLNGNGQLLCLGEHYKTKRLCLNAIESVKRFAKNAPILADSETVNKHA